MTDVWCGAFAYGVHFFVRQPPCVVLWLHAILWCICFSPLGWTCCVTTYLKGRTREFLRLPQRGMATKCFWTTGPAANPGPVPTDET